MIRVADLAKAYGTVRAVDGVSFDVGTGEVFGLLGPNGAGKTTTVEILEGLTPPDAGTVRSWASTRSATRRRSRSGSASSSRRRRCIPNLTVERADRPLRGASTREAVPTAQLIDELDLGEKRNAQTRHLSGGQRQRLSVALALVNDPELIFLDEPTTGLDPAARRALWDLIRDLRGARQDDPADDALHGRGGDRSATASRSWITARSWSWARSRSSCRRRFKERSVRFDAIAGARRGARSAALPAVTRVVREDGVVSLFTPDVPATIAGLLAADRGARDRAREPDGPPRHARGRLPRPHRSGAPRLRTTAMRALLDAHPRQPAQLRPRPRGAVLDARVPARLHRPVRDDLLGERQDLNYKVGWVDQDGTRRVGRSCRRRSRRPGLHARRRADAETRPGVDDARATSGR